MRFLLCMALIVLNINYVYTQAALEITLFDIQGNPVSDQLVLVSNPSIGFREQAFSNKQGLVFLSGLSTSGLYAVELSPSMLFQADPVNQIALADGKTISVSLLLLDKTLNLEAVQVTAGPYLAVNGSDAEVSSVLTAKELTELPVEGRDISRALFRLPNISLATGFFPEAPNVAINGANSLFTSYQIDGMDNNENFLGGQRFAVPVGFVRSITALTNNFSAAHGLSANGIINITSKSGTNTPFQEWFYLTRPGPVLDGTPEFAQRDLSGNLVKNGFQRHQAGFALGGPLKKDQTFYFLNVEHTTDLKDNALTADALGIQATLRGRNSFTYLSAKLDHYWSPRWQSALRVNTGWVSIERQGGGLEGGLLFPSAGNQQDRIATNIAWKNSYRANNWVMETNVLYGRFRWNYAQPMDDIQPNVTVEGPDAQVVAVLGHPGYVFDETENTLQLQQKWQWTSGNHSLRGGLELKSSRFSLLGGGNPNGSYVVRLTDNQLATLRNSGRGIDLSPTDLPLDAQVLFYGVELRPRAFGHTQQIWSGYIEDQWNLHPKWNLNLGLRYDYDNLSKGGAQKGDRNNLAPRIGLNYQRDANTTFRAGYGVYYDKILYAIYSDALQFNSNSRDYQRQIQALVTKGLLPADTDIEAVTHEGNLVASWPAVDYLQGPAAGDLQDQRDGLFQNELRILNPSGYQNPYSHQWMLGMQKKIASHTLVYVDVLHNRSHRLFRLRNLNAPAAHPLDPSNVVVRSAAEADELRPVPVFADAGGNYILVNNEVLRGAARNVVMTESAGESRYAALNLTIQRERGAGAFAWRLVYTLSKLENNTEDINFRAMDGNDFEAEWGPSINDRRHLINGLLYWYPTSKWRISLTSLIQSGQPVNRIPDARLYGTSDLNGDGRSFGDAYVGNSDRHPGESRNSDRLPGAVTFDWGASYTLAAGKSGKVELAAQVFNLLDADNWSGYANNATQSNQIQTGSAAAGVFVRRNAAPPRQFQFSLRYLFNE
ncbi:MAG: TonB-dependent receptor [Saprospiraceae bacterium]|nr:TonB-dependent receptor [Saprospiraceae bacterium]